MEKLLLALATRKVTTAKSPGSLLSGRGPHRDSGARAYTADIRGGRTLIRREEAVLAGGGREELLLGPLVVEDGAWLQVRAWVSSNSLESKLAKWVKSHKHCPCL